MLINRRIRPSSSAASMLNDALILVLAFVAAACSRFILLTCAHSTIDWRIGNWNSEPGALCLLLFVATYLWIAQQCGLYSPKHFMDIGQEVRLIAQACVN